MKKNKTIIDEEIIGAIKMLDEADVPTDNRMMWDAETGKMLESDEGKKAS